MGGRIGKVVLGLAPDSVMRALFSTVYALGIPEGLLFTVTEALDATLVAATPKELRSVVERAESALGELV